jgi:hypothetical protein
MLQHNVYDTRYLFASALIFDVGESDSKIGGPTRNRTGVRGFAVLYVTTPPSGLGCGTGAIVPDARAVKPNWP